MQLASGEQGGGGSALADLIDQRLDSIMTRWKRRVRTEAQHTAAIPETVLVDHIPEFLRDVASTLRRFAEAPDAAYTGQLMDLASMHGEQRYAIGADIRTIVLEYELLRETVFQAAETSDGAVSVEELGFFARAISTGIAEAVDRFAKSRERALRDIELRYQRLSKSGIVGTLEWEPSGTITAANDTLLEMLGYTREDLDAGALDLKELTPPEQRPATEEAFGTLKATGVLRALEQQLFRSDGERVTVLISGTALDEKRERGLGLVVDITEKKGFEEERARRAELDRELLAIVSHDLRNPLSAILLSSASLLRRGDLNERTKDGIGRIHGSAKRAESLVEDLLDRTRAQLGQGIPVHPVSVCLHSIVRQVVSEAELGSPERRVELTTEGDGTGEWDPGRLGQVVANLVGNALQHSPPESPVWVHSRGGESEVSLEVHNEGPPIPDDVKQKIFQPFQRGKSNAAMPGLGLGLYIAYSLVEAHHGSIDVRSSEGHGTTFTVHLPRRRSA